MVGVLAWGVLPPLALLAYLFMLDKVEREPISMVLKVLLAGCLCTILAIIWELIGDGILVGLLGMSETSILYAFISCFFVVAIAEEFSKRLAMMAVVWRSPHFDYQFDAVLYCVTSALGFALVENVEYMAMYGTEIALARLIPVHTICGVFMGLALGRAKAAQVNGDQASYQRNRVMSLLIPVLIHGFYDFSLSTGVEALAWVSLAGVFVLTIVAFILVHKQAKSDKPFLHWQSPLVNAVGGQVRGVIDGSQPGMWQGQPNGQPVQQQYPPQYGRPVVQQYPQQGQQGYPQQYAQPVQQGYPQYAQPYAQQVQQPYAQQVPQQYAQPGQAGYPQQYAQPARAAYPQQAQYAQPGQAGYPQQAYAPAYAQQQQIYQQPQQTYQQPVQQAYPQAAQQSSPAAPVQQPPAYAQPDAASSAQQPAAPDQQ